MATSPNYSWPEPDNTDLVKNGALAIRTMGNAIDTTMATMTPKSTYTAKGSIAAATGASTPANLSVGNNGETLVADSFTSTGLRYQGNYAAGKNKFINGDFRVWQRGTTLALAGSGYICDRWKVDSGTSTGTASQQAFSPGQTDVPGNPLYFQRIAMAGSSSGTAVIAQWIEGVDAFAGQTATLSFYAKISSGTASLDPQYVQRFGTGGSGAVAASMGTVALTTSWQKFTYTVAIPSISGKTVGASNALEIRIIGNLTAISYDFAQFQIEQGSVATAFQTATGTIQGELAACQRYYFRSGVSVGNYQKFGTGYYVSGTSSQIFYQFPVSMRVAPTSFDFSTLGLYDGSAIIAITASSLGDLSPTGGTINHTVASGGVAKVSVQSIANNSSSAYVAFNAEL